MAVVAGREADEHAVRDRAAAAIVAVPSLLICASPVEPGTPADQFVSTNQSPVVPVQTVCAPAAAGASNSVASRGRGKCASRWKVFIDRNE
jgi:hypothetical protein